MERKMRKIIYVLALIAVLTCPVIADTFSVTWVDIATNGSLINASATLTAINKGGGIYWLTDIVGTRNGIAFDGVIPPSGAVNTWMGVYTYDNILNIPEPNIRVPNQGWLFSIQFASDPNAYPGINIWTSDQVTFYDDYYSGGYHGVPIKLTVTQVPEPALPLLISLGVCAVCLFARRYRC
jgi:hypothetical protein